MESTTYQVPSSVETEPECINEIENVQSVTSAPVQDEMESTSDQVQDAVEAETMSQRDRDCRVRHISSSSGRHGEYK